MFKVIVLLLAAAASVIAAPACTAERVGSSAFFTDHVRISFGTFAVPVGKTVTATLVDLRTCSPLTSDTFPSAALTLFGGSVTDDDTVFAPGSAAAGSSVDSTFSLLASVPNGSEHLTFTSSASFTPGGREIYDLITKNVGVVFTIA